MLSDADLDEIDRAHIAAIRDARRLGALLRLTQLDYDKMSEDEIEVWHLFIGGGEVCDLIEKLDQLVAIKDGDVMRRMKERR